MQHAPDISRESMTLSTENLWTHVLGSPNEAVVLFRLTPTISRQAKVTDQDVTRVSEE